MLQLRLMEKRRELVSREAHEAMIDQLAGLVLTKLSGWSARIARGNAKVSWRPDERLAILA
jgi:hypothetical protein